MGFWGNFGKAMTGALGAMGHKMPDTPGIASKPREVSSGGVATGGLKPKRPMARPLSRPRSLSRR